MRSLALTDDVLQELERDLLRERDGNETYLPYMLGKLLNTLANDRNTNHTNWLNALRRSYNRRVSMRQDNPFYQYLIVPDSVVRQELERERLEAAANDREGEGAVEDDAEDSEETERRRKGIFTESEEKLRLAEGKKPLKPKHAPAVPLQENAVNDGFNAEMAEVIAQDAADAQATDQLERDHAAVKSENGTEQAGGGSAPDREGEEQFWEEQRAVEWKDLSLETKVDRISFARIAETEPANFLRASRTD